MTSIVGPRPNPNQIINRPQHSPEFVNNSPLGRPKPYDINAVAGLPGFIDNMPAAQSGVAAPMSAADLYSTIGRQGEQAGLDYWNSQIASQGIDAVRNSFAAAGADTANIATAVNSGFYDTGYQTGDNPYQQGNAINLSDYAKNISANNNAINRSYNTYDSRNNTIEEELALDPNAITNNPAPQGGPPIGLIGAEQALRGGLTGGIDAVTQGLNTGRADIGAGIDLFNNYTGQGNAALNLMGAQSGAQGQAAQQEAFNNYSMSPEQQYLREQGERAILRNQAAIGGLGGGNVQQELQRQGMGLAQQDYANQYNRLAGLSELGMQGSTSQANLRNALGDMSYQGGNALGNMAYQGGSALGTLAYKGGSEVGNMAYGTGNTLAAGRTRAGELIGQNITNTTSALGNIINQQGAGVADLTGTQSGNLAEIIGTAAAQMGLSQQQLAGLLSGVQMQMGSMVSGLPAVGQNSSGMDNLGKYADTAATVYAMSDKRLKTNIVKVGVVGRHNLYTWDWTEKGKEIADPKQPRIGVMAQEAMKLNPEAVVMGAEGYLKVKYSELT